MIIQIVNLLVITLVLAILTHALAWVKGFFIPISARLHSNRSFIHFLIAFLLFLILYSYLPSIFFALFHRSRANISHTLSIVVIMFLSMLIIASFALCYQLLFEREDLRIKEIKTNAIVAFLTYLISLPLVGFVASFLTLINLLIFGHKGEEQVAITFLKRALSHPGQAIVSLLAICLLAPIIEEVLFRGIFYRGMRKYFSLIPSLIFSSITFSLVHFSVAQGIGNIPLLGSLFVLSLYLGYLYERQKSLIAPMILHALFNLISAIRIIGFG